MYVLFINQRKLKFERYLCVKRYYYEQDAGCRVMISLINNTIYDMVLVLRYPNIASSGIAVYYFE